MILNKTKNKYKIQTTMELILILSLVAIVAIVSVSLYLSSIHNTKVGTLNDIISAQASSSNTLILKLSSILPAGAQIKNINFTGVPSGTSISVSLENQTPVYSNGYPEYSFSVDGLPEPLTYYNVTSLTYEANGRTIVVPTITGEPIAIGETSLYSSNSNSFPQPASIPSGVLYYVPITITNTQNISTSKPFQQMIQVQETQFSNYIAYNGNMANFEFFTQRGQVLPAWIESNTSGNLIIWVKIPGIPAKHSETIYLGFASKTTNLLSSSGTSGIGEAPQLSCPNPDNTANCPTYAQYDDGASVFTNYWNFAGTTISSAWTQVVPSGTTITQNNGITITTSSSSTYGGLILTNGFTGTQIFEGDVTAVSGVVAGLALQTGNSASSGGYDFNYWGGSVAYGSMSGGMNGNNNPNLQISTGIMGGVWLSSSSQVWYKNYVATSGSQTAYTLPSTVYPSIGIYYSSASTSITFQWVRTRAYPPNGVMPSVSFGQIQSS